MRNLISIVASLTIITTVCGLALGAIYEGTRERIEEQVLINKQIPAVEKIFVKAGNDLLTDRRTYEVGQNKKAWRLLFPGRRDKAGEPFGVAFESSAKGFGGDIGVMVGFDLTKNTIAGVAVTTHSETPGLGAKAQTDPAFGEQFRDLPIDTTFAVKQDGGGIDAISGATVTTRGVCKAVSEAAEFFQEHSDEIKALIREPAPERGGGQ